ncbi:MAG: CHASE2 domain-containing protein [Anaerolineae bacterium]|nr:CHASE2 domain-containing protein [Anaerolineae bacterium]
MERVAKLSPFVLRGLFGGTVVGLLLLLAYGLSLFQGLRLRSSDTLFVSSNVSDSVVVVAIDDASLQAYGRTPAEWPRTLHARAIQRLAEAGARVIAYELLMPESTPDDDDMRDAIEAARASDARTRFVIAAAGTGLPHVATSASGVRVIAFPAQLGPVRALAQAVDYVGGVSLLPDADGVVRRQPSFSLINSRLYPSFSVAAYLAYLRIPLTEVEQVLDADGDTLYITGDRALTVDSYGQWGQDFANTPGKGFPVVSFRDLIDERVDPEALRDRVVVVGLLNATGVLDTYQTPVTLSGQEMAGVEIQAHAIDSLIHNTARTAQTPGAIVIMIVVLSYGSALLYEHLRTFWKPAAMIGLLILFAVVASYVFTRDRIVVDVFDGVLALVLTTIVSVAAAVRRQYYRRRDAEVTALMSNREKERLEKLLFGLPVSVAILDKDGIALRINEAFASLLTPLALRNQWSHLAERLEQSGMDTETAAKLRASLDDGKRYTGEIILDAKTYNLTTTWLDDLKEWIVVLTDITTLAELNRVKREMLLMIAHDLRNPLSTVNVYVYQLRKFLFAEDEKVSKVIDHIEKASHVMQAILSDVIDLEQIRSLEFPRSPVDMRQVIRSVAERYEPDCTAKSQTMTLDLNDEAPPAFAHEGQISQVIANLVSNAVKYTPAKGTITLRLYSETPTHLRIAVQDTGIGIPADEQSKLFAEFYRVRTRATSDISGTGLGLSIVKSVVERHQGRVWFESVEGKGTTFYVELPVRVTDAAAN